MCGIIGYVGSSEAVPILLGGLSRLEYRGYDSAGVATIANGAGMEIRRTVGKLENLRRALEGVPLKGSIGIGHTRWATHGRPSEGNAHPHKAGPVAVIHNGIVENYVELRATLTERGHKLRSETDTELISHLIEERVRAGTGLTEAVRQTVLELRGSFSIVVLSETEPDKLVAAKTATPLVLGLGEGENFVASDIPAILGHTRRTIVLEDGELAELTAQGVRLMTFAGAAIERVPRLIEWDAVAATKGGFQHYLRKEIAEQPQAWIDTLSGRAAAGSNAMQFEGELLPAAGPQAIRRIVMVSAGASWISSLIGKFMIEELSGVPAEVDYSAEFRYRQPPIDERTMMIAVSQSGETADTLAALEEGRRHGCHLLAITNTVDSSIARKADAQLYTRCGPEISVTTTKCFLTQIEAFYLFAIHLAARLGRLSEREVNAMLQPAFAIPAQIKEVLEKRERQIERVARKYGKARDFLYLGRGINYPVALEGALKLKEISYIHAEGYSAGEMKHGPIALIDEEMPVVVIIPRDNVYEKTLSNLREVESRNGRIIAVTDYPTPELAEIAWDIIEVPTTHRMLMPVLTTVPLQLLAYHIAVYRGTDVDQPRNLAKSVTVE
ncbi:MAG TPA: glutamine--fructose-6-phosphate transaminase (isomerizing) [Candidatus Binataceae bacterium]|jgi:glucosamine--fructose-6-phosphate aminotransferase (isomerizing)|nr:glutamine--fructose-6-phosphate transaminase (isomerizing) [Candidatus Binataceae bacterium]